MSCYIHRGGRKNLRTTSGTRPLAERKRLADLETVWLGAFQSARQYHPEVVERPAAELCALGHGSDADSYHRLGLE